MYAALNSLVTHREDTEVEKEGEREGSARERVTEVEDDQNGLRTCNGKIATKLTIT